MFNNLKFLTDTIRFSVFRKRNPGGGGALFVRPDNIGDFAIWAPFASSHIGQLKTLGIKTTLLCKSAIAELAKTLLRVDEIICFDQQQYLKNPSPLLKHIADSHFDMLFAPRVSREFKTDDMIAIAAGAKISYAVDCPDYQINPLVQKISSRRYKKLFHLKYSGELSAAAEFHQLPPSLEPGQILHSLPRLPGLSGEYIVLFPGAADKFRCIDPSTFAAVSDAVSKTHPDLTTVICGSESEVALSRKIVELLECRTINLTGKTTLLQAAALIAHAKTVIGNESGAIHLAALANVPALCAAGFGHFNRFVPYPLCSHITPPVTVTADGLWECRNCNWRCSRPNADETLPCIKNITSDKLVEATLQILDRK